MNQLLLLLTLPSLLLAAANTTPALPTVPPPVLGLSVATTVSSSSAQQTPACENSAQRQAEADSLFASASWNKAFQAYESLCPRYSPASSRTP
jgi:hypothetical protein